MTTNNAYNTARINDDLLLGRSGTGEPRIKHVRNGSPRVTSGRALVTKRRDSGRHREEASQPRATGWLILTCPESFYVGDRPSAKVACDSKSCCVRSTINSHSICADILQLLNSELPAGYNADLNDKSTMSFRDNFTGFWNIWKHGIIQRDYALLDEIHPNRIKSVEEWLRRDDQLGRKLGRGSLWERVQPENQLKQPPLLKLTEDKRKGRL